MSTTAEAIAVAEEVGVLKQLSQHYGGGAEGIRLAFKQRVVLFHPDSGCAEPGKFRALMAARDQLLGQLSAIELALHRSQTPKEDTR